jgi:hypothetical protein
MTNTFTGLHFNLFTSFPQAEYSDNFSWITIDNFKRQFSQSLYCYTGEKAELKLHIPAMNPLVPTPQKSEDLISIYSHGLRDFNP